MDRREGVTKRRDVFSSISTGLSIPIGYMKKGGQGFRLPSPAKFQSGHLTSGVIPVSLVIPVTGNDGGSGSDMDLSSDSEDEINRGRYSLVSSPQDGMIPNGVASRYTGPMQTIVNYGADKKHLSSPGKPIQQKQGDAFRRFQNGIAENELSDSATSTDVSYMYCKSANDAAPLRGSYTSDSHSSGATSRTQVETTAKQDFLERRLKDDKDMPSAPPISSSVEVREIVEKISTLKATNTPLSANLSCSVAMGIPKASIHTHSDNTLLDETGHRIPDPSERITTGREANVSTSSMAACFPTFHASGQGLWSAVISYDACVRLCLHSWAKGCTEEAPYFLNNECAVLRSAFSLQRVLLQSEEELLTMQSVELVSERATAPKSKNTYGKMKVQVRKVKIGLDQPAGCSFSSLSPATKKLEPLRKQFSNINSALHSGWEAVRKVRVTPHIHPNGTFSQQSLAYMRASTQYIKQVSRLLRNGVTTLHSGPSSYEAVQETHTCLLLLKSSTEEDLVRMQPGSGESHVFFPDNHGDELIIEVQDSKRQYCGHVLAQVATIADDLSDKIRWWPIYHEPEHELVGRIQLYINYSTAADESNYPKHGCVAETVAYDFVLEVAMQVQQFQQRNLLLHGPWKWLVAEFASYYGVSDAYANLRYLSYVMDVATPSRDCLELVHDLLLPVIAKHNRKSVLSHQENRILGEVEDEIQQILALVFEHYKSLDESSPSGMIGAFGPGTGLAAPALAPAVKLYALLHDILSSEAQLKFCRYFQAAAKKRSRRHVAETDEFISSNERTLMDPVILTNYEKMKSLIMNIRNEIFTDIQIYDQNVLPSFIDLPNLCASVYNLDLSSRLRAFLVACPPSGPSRPVTELVIATADFQMALASWNIKSVKGGVDAKELFNSYITLWIQEKRLSLLDICRLDKVKWSGVRTQQATTPFVDEMYEQLKQTLNEYQVIISRWPEYIAVLEDAIADVEKEIIESLDKQYADVLSPLKESLTTKIFGFKYVQKFAKRTGEIYFVPDELGILLNSMKRMLDVLRPKIETLLKSWTSSIHDGANTVAGESLSEVTVMLRSKFRSYIQAVVEKLVENTKIQNSTKLKRIIQDSKEILADSDVRSRIQPLKDLVIKTIDHVQSVVEPHVFLAICRGFWDRMGHEVLSFLQNSKEKRSCYKASRIAVSILDDIFASQIQQLLGNVLQGKDLEPPRSIMEVRSVLCKDAINYQDNYFY